jgi:integrase
MSLTDLKAFIHSKRPSLSQSSVVTYNSILTNLFKHVFGEHEPLDPSKFHDKDKVLNHLKDLPPNRRKTILSSLVVVCPDVKEYREIMMADIKKYTEDIAKQEKTPTQRENWVDAPEIKQVLVTLKKHADLLYKKQSLSENDLQDIQKYILLCLLSGQYFPVRRSKDYCDFKIANIKPEKDNYIDKSTLVFNSYKTAKAYGEQRISIPIQMKNILNKWIKVASDYSDYLFFDKNKQPLTSVKLNQRLNKIFDGKKISVNALRHAYLTDKYGHTIHTNNELAEDMKEMGSSKAMATTYIKN